VAQDNGTGLHPTLYRINTASRYAAISQSGVFRSLYQSRL